MNNPIERATQLLRRYQTESTSVGGPRWQEINDICAEFGRSMGFPRPIDMVLHCPACGVQHIDAPDDHPELRDLRQQPWTNPPHRSHLCHGCGHIWRPADVPTNGVQAMKTAGKADSPIGTQPTELEMHRADYKACKDAGFESPGELLASYRYLATQDNAKARRIEELVSELMKANKQ